MNPITKSPLWDRELEGAAHICLEMAAKTEHEGGSGTELRERGERFKVALEKRMRGAESLLHLGLSLDDLSWALNQTHRAVDKNGWEERFRTAHMRLRDAS